MLIGADGLPVFTNCAEIPKLDALIAATTPAGVLADAATAIVLVGCVATGEVNSASRLAVEVSVKTPSLFAPDE